MKLLLDRIPASLYLSLIATLISVCIALPLGIISAIKRGTIFDRIGMTLALLGQSIPAFWAGIMLILLFAVQLGWFPPSGYGGPKHVILPAVTLALFFSAATARLTRSSVLDVLDMDYVRYARLKGVPEFVVIIRHVLRNSFITILNIVALQLGLLLGGAVITEFIFSWPGIGRLSLDAIYNRDYPVIQATVVVAASFFVVINLLVDIIYSATDPRVSRK
jgi:peptide/nickel transport system permease protein